MSDKQAIATLNKIATNFVGSILKNDLSATFMAFAKHIASEAEMDEDKLLEVVASFEMKKTEVAASKKKPTKKEKDPNAPKRATSAYIFFTKDKRQEVKDENPDFTFGEIGKELGRLWGELSDKKKAKWKKMEEEDKERYTKEMEDYKSGDSESESEHKEKKPKAQKETSNVKAKVEEGRKKAQEKSEAEDKIFCYNISSGRLVLFDEKKPGDRVWDTSLFLCAKSKEELAEYQQDQGGEEAPPKEKKSGKGRKKIEPEPEEDEAETEEYEGEDEEDEEDED